MTADLLVATGLVGLAASVAGATVPARLRTQVVSALTVAACGCGLAAAVEVLRTGRAAVVHTDRLLPLSGLSLTLDRFGALFVAISAVVASCAMVFRLGYDGHGLSSRTASCTLPLFVTTLLLVPAAASVTTFLFVWELMAITSLLLVLVDHRRRPEVAVAGQWYAVMTQFGAAALLVGLVLLSTHAGSQSFAAIAAGASRFAPATSTCTSPSFCAAATALRDGCFTPASSNSSRTRAVMIRSPSLRSSASAPARPPSRPSPPPCASAAR